MRTITITFMLATLIGCGEQSVIPMTDAGVVGDGGLPTEDANAQDDAATPDSGDRDSSTPDAGVPDAGDRDSSTPDAGTDAGTTADAGAPDSGTPGADAGTDSSVPMIDAGPPRPVGGAIDVTGSRCAIDTAGSMWCWGRWAPVEDIRLLGTGFDSASGSCALRGREVWCAEFTTETMIPVIDGSATLEVDSIAEYSDLERGCGMRLTPEGWGEAVCWTDGGGVAREGGTGAELVAVSATSPREVMATSGYIAIDLNPPATCRVGAVGGATCARDTGGTYGIARPAGDHLVIGFAMLCAHSAGATTCATGSSPVTIADVGGVFHDQAVAWPIGPLGAPGTMPFEARGICISGSGVRCYDSSGTLAYTVNW